MGKKEKQVVPDKSSGAIEETTLSEIETQAEKINQAISEVPEQDRNEVISLVMEKREIFQGPIPAPQILAGYEKTCPGAAERIIKMTENQQSHRFNLENRSLEAEIKSEKRGQWMGFSIVIVFLTIAGLLLYSGQSAAGLITLGGIAVALVGLFIYGRYQPNQVAKNSQVSEKKDE